MEGKIMQTTKGKCTNVYEAMDAKFPVSTEMSIAKTKGKIRCMVEEFKNECKDRIKSEEQFGPEEFQTALREFLKKSETELEREFNSCCEFSSVVSVAEEHLQDSYSEIDQLRKKADFLCRNVISDPSRLRSDSIMCRDESECRLAPNLGEIKSQVDSRIPRLTFSLKERLMYAFRSAGVWLKNMFRDSDEREVSGMEGVQIAQYTKVSQLKRLFDDVKEHMEQMAGQYLEDIRPHAIMHLYKKHYCVPLEKRLCAYNKEFKHPLKLVQDEIAETKVDIEGLTSRLESLKTCTEQLSKSKVSLKTYCDKITF